MIDSQAELPRLLAGAKRRVRVQVMDYAPLSFGPERSRPFYAVIDNALRNAAARGVQIELMVANWNTKKRISRLKSGAGAERADQSGDHTTGQQRLHSVCRVIHSKLMTIDDEIARVAPATGPAAIWTTRAIWSW